MARFSKEQIKDLSDVIGITEDRVRKVIAIVRPMKGTDNKKIARKRINRMLNKIEGTQEAMLFGWIVGSTGK